LKKSNAEPNGGGLVRVQVAGAHGAEAEMEVPVWIVTNLGKLHDRKLNRAICTSLLPLNDNNDGKS
jgi:hypothetical protein